MASSRARLWTPAYLADRAEAGAQITVKHSPGAVFRYFNAKSAGLIEDGTYPVPFEKDAMSVAEYNEVMDEFLAGGAEEHSYMTQRISAFGPEVVADFAPIGGKYLIPKDASMLWFFFLSLCCTGTLLGASSLKPF